MTAATRQSLYDRWLPIFIPMVFAIFVNAVLVGVAYGRLESAVSAEVRARTEHDTMIASTVLPMDQLMKIYVTKNEWDIQVKSLSEQNKDLKESVKELNAKVDLLLQRMPSRNN